MAAKIIKTAARCIILASSIANLLVAINDVAYEAKVYLKCDKEIEGVVTDYYDPDLAGSEAGEKEAQEEASKKLYPVVSYEVNGEQYRHSANTEIGSYPYETGIRAMVRYYGKEPGVAILKVEIYDAAKNFILQALISAVGFIVAALLKDRPKEADPETDDDTEH